MTVLAQRISHRRKGSPCPIAGTLDVLGDKWSLLIIRDLLFFDKRQYSDFLNSSESISTNILADRLQKLEQAGLVTKKAYQQAPRRYAYHPTDKARSLLPVMLEIIRWGSDHIPGTFRPRDSFWEKYDSGLSFDDTSSLSSSPSERRFRAAQQ